MHKRGHGIDQPGVKTDFKIGAFLDYTSRPQMQRSETNTSLISNDLTYWQVLLAFMWQKAFKSTIVERVP